MTNPILEAALAYAAKGWPVFPVWGITEKGNCACMKPQCMDSGKHPASFLVPNGLLNATIDIQVITKWFTDKNYLNVGIVTGSKSFIAVDIDWIDKNPENGLAPYDDFPNTLTVKSGSGAKQLWYLPDETVRNHQKIRSSIDIRGNGGYVVAPPSRHKSGGIYEFLNDAPMSPFPQSLVTTTLAEFRPTKQYSYDFLYGQDRNDRHNALVRFTYLMALYVKLGKISINEGWEACLNRREEDSNFEEKTIEEWKSAYESALRKREVKPEEEKKDKKLVFTTFESLYNKPLKPLEWLIEGLIPINGVTAISGSPGAYKSWLALYIAIQSAIGGSFLNGQLPMKQKGILYIDEENGERLLQSRMKSLTLNKKINVHFSIYGDAKFNEEYIKQVINYALANKLEVIIFDSFVRFLDGHSENASEDIASIYGLFKKLLKNDLTVMFLHHHKKENGVSKTSHNDLMRGSGDILAQVNSHIILDKKEQIVTVTHNKMREALELKPFNFSLDEDKNGQITFTHRDMSQYELLGMDTETQKLIITTLDEKGRCTVKQLLEFTGIYEKRLRAVLGKLESDGMVKSENITDNKGKGGKKKEYFLSELSRLV